MTRRYANYLPEGGGRVDLADQIANSVFDDPEPIIWIGPVEFDEPGGQWSASCQFDEASEEFHGSRDEAIAWARRTPATRRHEWTGKDYVELEPAPGDAPPPPPSGPSVQVQGPDHDGRWVALWFHRDELRQFWGGQDEVTAWARAQPAERRRISVDGEGWRPLEA